LAAFFFGASSESDPELDPESLESFFLAAAFLAGAFLTGLSESESLSELDAAFLAAALTGAFFCGFSSLSESESDEELF